jgi:xyloglucan-specific exo-beta-1,4-glucanase
MPLLRAHRASQARPARRFGPVVTLSTVTALAAAGLLASLFTPSSATSASAGTGSASTGSAALPYSWRNVQIVGGGFVDGLVFNATEPGLAYARTDIGGAYRWDAAAGRWIPLMDFTGFDDWNELGVESIATDPIDPAKVWVAAGQYPEPWAVPLNGEILRSDNQGRTWRVTDLPIQLASNENGRNMGERLAVDPEDDSVLYLASPVNGLWRSTDGGATWAQVTSFPVSSTPDDVGLSFVTFDPAGGHGASHPGQPTRDIFVGNATGTDLYESTDAGATWQLVPGEPTGMEPQHGVMAAGGVLYVDYANQPGPNGMTDGSVWKYDTRTGAWTDITPEVPGVDGNPQFGYAGLAVDPEHPDTVMVATNDRWYPIDTIFRSTDAGATWEDVGASAKLDISASPFLAWGATPKFGWWIASIAIDPFNPNHVIFGTGATVFGTDDVTAADHGQATTWSSAAAEGIEETAVNDLVAPDAGPCELISAVGDLGGFCHTTLDSSPAAGMIEPILGTGESIGEAGGAPLDVAEVGYSGGDWSTDGGATWTAMTLPPGSTEGAGVVAVSSDGSQIVWAPVDAAPAYSTDGGQTWTPVTGLAEGLMPVADPVTPGVFYAFDPATGTLLESTDGGATFTAQTAGLPAGVGSEQSSSAPQLHTVPGRPGDLWLTAGNGELYHSAGHGESFSPVSSVTTVATLGFGKAAPGADYPAIYLVGIVDGVQGIFRSTDEGATWLRINNDSEQYAWTGQTITGSPRVFGQVFLGTNGRGILVAGPAGGGA